MARELFSSPAEAGVQNHGQHRLRLWTPAFAGEPNRAYKDIFIFDPQPIPR